MAMRTCPICRRPFDLELSPAPPFCSDRCRTIDIGRWLTESYSVPHEPDDDPDDGGEVEPSDGSADPDEAAD